MYVHSACTACMIFNNFHSDMETVVHASDLYGGAFVVFAVRKKTSWPESLGTVHLFCEWAWNFWFRVRSKIGGLVSSFFFWNTGIFWISDFGSLTWSRSKVRGTELHLQLGLVAEDVLYRWSIAHRCREGWTDGQRQMIMQYDSCAVIVCWMHLICQLKVHNSQIKRKGFPSIFVILRNLIMFKNLISFNTYFLFMSTCKLCIQPRNSSVLSDGGCS